ncbi:MAG: HD domain-containing protein [Clostridium sp.]|nr:HD domain-containing protein [Clostridium sp.]MDU7086037.1 HD domain-containing protein [Clostridium sp.]
MEIKTLLETMKIAENLKNNTRHSWTSSGRHESVAEHSWSLSLMAYFISDEFPEADINKILQMCIFHDIGEAFTGDIPVFLKTDDHEVEETKQINNWLNSLPAPYQSKLKNLFEEMEAQETLESKIYKALDKMEVLFQHNQADISTWLPLEYKLNLEHGTEQVEFSDYLKQLKSVINEESRKKINEAK